MTWADLFERAADCQTSVDAICERLADRRANVSESETAGDGRGGAADGATSDDSTADDSTTDDSTGDPPGSS